VKKLLQAPWTPSGRDSPVDPNQFYAVTLSGVGGRAMVREWIEQPVPRVRENVRRWFRDLTIVLDRSIKSERDVLGEPGELYCAWPLRRLIRAVGRRTERGTDLAASLPSLLFAAAVSGKSLPDLVLAAAVHRTVAERDVPPHRAALLRLILNRLRSTQDTESGGRLMSEALDTDRRDPAYLCGRLLAALARLQYLALGPTNATIVDRYYGAASTTPATVFGQLMHLAQSHLAKLGAKSKGAAVNLEKDLEEILAKLTDWPRQLPLQDQALFALGYYHQRAEYRRRPKDRAGSEGEEPIPVPESETVEDV